MSAALPVAVGDLVLIRTGWNRVYELSETSVRVGASGMGECPIWVWRSEVRAVKPRIPAQGEPDVTDSTDGLYVQVNGGELERIEDVYRPEGVAVVQAELRKARELRALAQELFVELVGVSVFFNKDGDADLRDLIDRAQDMLYPGTRDAS